MIKTFKTVDLELLLGERLYLGQVDANPADIQEHTARYEFATRYLGKDDHVLDAACGSGYGSEILAQSAKKVTSVDRSRHGISWAETHHSKENINYQISDLNRSLPFPEKIFDAVVSFETLEHVEDQNRMLSELKRVLKPNGRLILSTPDRNMTVGKAGSRNRYHVRELTKQEALDLIRKYFQVETLFGQTQYQSLPWQKRLLQKAAQLDVFEFRRKIAKKFGLRQVLHNHFSTSKTTPIQETDLAPENDYFFLIFVCANR